MMKLISVPSLKIVARLSWPGRSFGVVRMYSQYMRTTPCEMFSHQYSGMDTGSTCSYSVCMINFISLL